MAARRVTEGEIARILQLIASRPGARRRRRPGDVEGGFDDWAPAAGGVERSDLRVDGGAARADGEGRAYQLGAGTRVSVAGGPSLSIVVELPGGATVIIEQRLRDS